MRSYSVLHLSDLHFNLKKWPDTQLIVQGLIDDLAIEFARGAPRPDACIFSGDLFQAGGPGMPSDELLKNVIEPILHAAGLTVNELFICPGNHDVDRESVRENAPIQTGMAAALPGRDELNKFYDGQKKSVNTAYFSRLDHFNQFSQSFGLENIVNKNNFYASYVQKLGNGLKVGIASFNTAWLSTGEPLDVDRAKLLIPERAIHDAIADLKDVDLRVAIHHHPLDYLADFCRFDTRALLHKHFNLICYGHMHQAMPVSSRSVVGEAISSEAGALYTWRGFYNGYCLITLEPDDRRVVFRHRKWADSPAYKFVSANEFGDDGKTLFFWGDAEQVALTRTALDVNSSLRDVLESMANEHLLSSHTTTHAPKNFRELYVDPPITVRSGDQSNPFVETSYVGLGDIMAGTGIDVIYGNRESGKTSLAFQLCLRQCSAVESNVRIPVFIDIEKSNFSNNVLRREAQKLLLGQGKAKDVEKYLDAGIFVFVLDNFLPSDPRWSSSIAEFVKKNPAVKVVLFADENAGPFKKTSEESDLSDARLLSVHPLKRREVKELTKKWLAPSGLYNKDAFYAVLKKIQNSGLPTTAYVVSMVAWTLERQNLNTNINEAALLERFVDAILNKADAQEVSRASLDYTIRESFLAELAYQLRDREVFTISITDLDAIATSFINSRGWTTNAANFVRQLISTGILIRVDDIVGFRYRCLREYFLAKYLLEDEEFREVAFSDEKYLEFSREIDLLTGLTRKSGKLLKDISIYTERRVKAGFEVVSLVDFDKIGFRFGAERTLLARPESLSDLGIDDAVVEEILDSADQKAAPKSVRGDLEDEEKMPSKQRIHDLSVAYASMVLLSKVVRNNELLKDLSMKTEIVHQVLDYWAQYIGYVVTAFDSAIDADNADIDNRRFDRLTVEQKQFVEHFIKITFPLMFSSAIHGSLGTEKLRSIFESIVDDEKKPVIVRLLVVFLLIDVSFIDRSEAANEMIKRVEGFAKNSSSRLITELICEKLLLVYNTPHLGEPNRRLIERLYAETQLKALGVSSRSAAYGTSKSGIVKELRQQVAKVDKDADTDSV